MEIDVKLMIVTWFYVLFLVFLGLNKVLLFRDVQTVFRVFLINKPSPRCRLQSQHLFLNSIRHLSEKFVC